MSVDNLRFPGLAPLRRGVRPVMPVWLLLVVVVYVAASVHDHVRGVSPTGDLPTTPGVPSWLHIAHISGSKEGKERGCWLDAVQPPVAPAIACKLDSRGIWQLVPASSARARDLEHPRLVCAWLLDKVKDGS
jgi:hypothetical protein